MSEISCGHCGESNYRLNGQAHGKQRYFCKVCERNFSVREPKAPEKLSLQKVLVILFYGTGRTSYQHLAKLFGVCPATIIKWVKKYGETIAQPEVSADLEHIEIDEMWHFLNKKKTSFGCSKLLIEQREKLLPGLQTDGTL